MTQAQGFIKNVNTVEDFNNTDKKAMLNNAGRQVCVSLGARSLWIVLTIHTLA